MTLRQTVCAPFVRWNLKQCVICYRLPLIELILEKKLRIVIIFLWQRGHLPKISLLVMYYCRALY